MKSHPGVAAKVFATLGREGINIEMISTSPIKLSCVVQGDQVTGAVKALHEAFGWAMDDSARSTPSRRHDGYRVAVVGATGAVGTVTLGELRERGFPASEIVPFASARSAGKELDGFGTIQPLGDETIQGFDLAIFSAGATTSGEWAPRFVDAGCVVVDNSSKWRRDDEIPLVVAEVNPHALDRHRGLTANPNCSTKPADGRAQADPRRRRHRAADRLDPTSPSRGRASRPSTSSSPRRTPSCTTPSRRRPRSIRTPSRSTSWAAPATSRTATTTRTRSAR